MELMELIHGELFVLVPVLYALGMALKKSPIKDWLIPYLLCGVGCVLSFAYLVGEGGVDLLTLLFSAVTQGVLCTACSVYANNLFKQAKKGKEDDA